MLLCSITSRFQKLGHSQEMQNGVLIRCVCLNDVSVEMLSVSYVFNICRKFFFF